MQTSKICKMREETLWANTNFKTNYCEIIGLSLGNRESNRKIWRLLVALEELTGLQDEILSERA